MAKTYIIAEIAQGFEGDPRLCRKFIDLAKKVGADAVKFQIFRAEELCTRDYQYHDLFKSLEIEPKVWGELIDHAHSIGVDFLADIFGVATLEWMSKTKTKGFKIHSTDVKNYDLLQALKGRNYRIYLATGGSALEDVQRAVKILSGNDLVLMSGFQAEPNQLGDVELDKLGFLAKEFQLPVGYADHIDAKDSLAIWLPVMAVLRGANVIEKHLTIERDQLALEDSMSALNPNEFIQMVQEIRKVESFRQTGSAYTLSEREEAYRKRSKKVILAKTGVKKGEKIRDEHLKLLRTGNSQGALVDLELVIGRTAKVDLRPDSVITADVIE